MADNKLTWKDLRRSLAKRAGVSEKEANTFLSALNEQLIEALKQDKQVKVNGLGMFKLQAVAPRKSVNVTTGEEITIEGYNKLSFVPEAGVKELVEKSHQPSAVNVQIPQIIDPIRKLGAQAEEIVGILGELGQSPEEPKQEEPVVVEEPKPEEPVVAEEPKPEEPKQEEPVVVEEPKTEEPVVVEEPKPEEPKQEEPGVAIEPKGKKQYHFVRDTLICVVILLMLLLAGYFFLRQQISGWIESLAKPQTEVTAEVTEDIVSEEPAESVATPSVEEIEQPAEETKAAQPAPVTQKPKRKNTVRKDYSAGGDILLTEEIVEGSRLAWIAKKHYGNKIYWPYLYEANKDRIKNPSVIPVGTPIRVPRLSAEMRDTTSTRFQQIREEAYSAVH